mgnify:CR=1 FL=1
MTNNQGEIVDGGMAIMRVENENQQIAAIQRPRNEKKILDGALEELRMSPDFAKKAYYSIPYKDAKGNIVNVEGPSISSAMTLARRWGNCANGSRVVGVEAERIIVEGVFIDYETNLRTLRQVPVSMYRYDKQTNSTVPLRDDKLTMAISAGSSKAVRNAILASLPVGLIHRYISEAKSLTVQNGPKRLAQKSVKDRILALMDVFVSKGADAKSVGLYMNQLMAQGNETETLATMNGTLTAIEDGHASIADVFGGQQSPQAVSGPLPTVTDLLDASKTTKK